MDGESADAMGLRRHDAGEQTGQEHWAALIAATQRGARIDRLIAEICHRFVNLPPSQVGAEIARSLAAIGELLAVDRACFGLLDVANRRLAYHSEWRRRDSPPLLDLLPDDAAERSEWLASRFNQAEPLFIPDVAALPTEMEPERSFWLGCGIRSLFAVPIMYHGQAAGFIGATYDDRPGPLALDEDEQRLLYAAGDAFVQALRAQQVALALADQEARFRAFFQHSPVAMGVLDAEMRYVAANSALAAYNGLPVEAHLGRRMADLFPRLHAILEPIVRRVLATGQPVLGFEMTGPARDASDEIRYFSISGFPIDGTMVGFVVDDITSLKGAELARQASEQRLKLALETSHAGAWEWDIATNRAVWTEENYRLLGYAPGEVEARYENWLACVHPDDRSLAERMVATALTTRSDLDMTFRVVWPDGSIHWIRDVGRILLDAAGAPRGMVGVQIDITKQREIEQRLQAAIAERDMLLRELHHRIKNNLQTIVSLVSLQASAVDPNVANLLRDLEARVRAMTLIHESLYRSQDLTQVNMAEHLTSLIDSLRSMFATPLGMAIHIEVLPILVALDVAIPCGLIVNELITNVFKHAFPPGWKGDTCAIWISLERDGDHLVLTVRDNGVGLPAGFDWRNTSSLGLRLVNMLAFQLDGELEISDDSGMTCRLSFVNPEQEGQHGS